MGQVSWEDEKKKILETLERLDGWVTAHRISRETGIEPRKIRSILLELVFDNKVEYIKVSQGKRLLMLFRLKQAPIKNK